MDDTASLQEKLQETRKSVSGALKRERRKLKKQLEERDEASQWEELGQMADTLLASPGAVAKGMKEVELPNIHTGKQVVIPLNPKCTAEKSAELLYKKARRGKRGYDACVTKVEETTTAIETMEFQLDEVRSFLTDGGLVGREVEAAKFCEALASGKQSAPSKPKPVKTHPFRHYHIDGWDIYAGKTSRDNDELSTRFSKPSDIWFHAVGYAGSHVIIRRPKNTPMPPTKIIEIAGGISVFFSKAKNTSYAEVHMTEARYVRKPRKAPPGLVTAERCKTLRMSPVDPQSLFTGDYSSASSSK